MSNDATSAPARKIATPRVLRRPAPSASQAPAPSTVAAVSTDTTPTFQECRALFQMVAQCLRDASQTDEPHEHSGESDRLLRIGSNIAFDAVAHPNEERYELAAYDVAACINAARLVPGDVESSIRKALIDTAAVALASITENSPDQIVFTGVKRPILLGKTAVMPTRDQIMAVHFDAMCWMGCAEAVLELYAASADSDAIFGLRDLLAAYYCKVEESEVSEEVGDFIDGILPDMSRSLACIIDLVDAILIRHDDSALHGVAYLLGEAKAIADGKRFGAGDGGAA